MTLTAARRSWSESDKQIVKNVKIICSGAGLDHEQLASLLGMTRQTLFRRLKEPSSFKMNEIRILTWVADQNDITIKQMT